MFKNRRIALLTLAIITVVCLLIAYYVNSAGAALISETQEGCLVISEVGWAGTEASTSDEWYEIENTCNSTVTITQDEWYLETVSGTSIVTATVPVSNIPAFGICLYERTDDNAVASRTACGINGSAGTGSSLTGIFTNSGVDSFALRHSTDLNSYHELAFDGSWPAGSSSPRASMQKVNGQWYTSNQGVEKDASGNTILGTPGAVNELPSSNPDTCGFLPDNVELNLDVIVNQDLSGRVEATLTSDLWGVAPDGSLIATTGAATVVFFESPSVNGETGWTLINRTWDKETSVACIDAFENVTDDFEQRLRKGNVIQPSQLHTNDWSDYYVTWIATIHEFQTSGMTQVFLPAIQK